MSEDFPIGPENARFGRNNLATLCDDPCAYRKSNPGILVVQSTQNRATENASNCLGGT